MHTAFGRLSATSSVPTSITIMSIHPTTDFGQIRALVLTLFSMPVLSDGGPGATIAEKKLKGRPIVSHIPAIGRLSASAESCAKFAVATRQFRPPGGQGKDLLLLWLFETPICGIGLSTHVSMHTAFGRLSASSVPTSRTMMSTSHHCFRLDESTCIDQLFSARLYYPRVYPARQ